MGKGPWLIRWCEKWLVHTGQLRTSLPVCHGTKHCNTEVQDTRSKKNRFGFSVLYSQPVVFTVEVFYVYIQIYERIPKHHCQILHGKGPRPNPKIEQEERNEANPLTLSRDLKQHSRKSTGEQIPFIPYSYPLLHSWFWLSPFKL